MRRVTSHDALVVERTRGDAGTKARDDETLETEQGSCENDYCPCHNCRCGKGCRCTPLSVPRVVIADSDGTIGGGGVQFAVAVRGMTCEGCAQSVTNSIAASTSEVLDVKVDLSTARAFLALDIDATDRDLAAAVQFVLDSIEDVGFEAELDVSSLPEEVPLEFYASKSATKTKTMTRTRTEKKAKTETETETKTSREPENRECGICLEAIEKPITLPCGHTFSAKCLDIWRSKYDVREVAQKTCPLCREAMPPSKEMVSQLASWKRAVQCFERDGDVFSTEHKLARSKVEELEAIIGSCNEIMESGAEENCVKLPGYITKAAMDNNVKRILQWTGPAPDGNRLDAHDPDMMNITMLHAAAANGHVDLAAFLLQLGASVDPVDANGQSPLRVKSVLDGADRDGTIPLLLQWGAAVSADPATRRTIAREAYLCGNARVAEMFSAELGGRRCEIINVVGSAGLNGATCIVDKYLVNRNVYKVIFEYSKKVFLVDPGNLKRNDRTPGDPGYYVTVEKGRFKRNEFLSKEECQAFVASLSTVRDSGLPAEGLSPEADARTIEATETLLAEFSREDPFPTAKKSRKTSKRKKKKKGKKKRL